MAHRLVSVRLLALSLLFAPSLAIAEIDQGYLVGNQQLFIHDRKRPIDATAGINEGVRTLITEIWYPVEADAISADAKKATYGDYVFGSTVAHQLMMTQTTFLHLTPETVSDGVSGEQIKQAIAELFQRERNSYPNAPVATRGAPFPLIVMSHGDAGSRYNMESVAEFIAAKGYIVIAPEHTGNSPFSMLGHDPALAVAEEQDPLRDILPLLDSNGIYGRHLPNGQSYQPLADGVSLRVIFDLDKALVERVNDLRATVDEASRLNENGPFSNRIDLNNIGLTGRSFGGLTTLTALEMEPRFKAGFAVVPAPLPDFRLPKLVRYLLSWGNESALFNPRQNNGIHQLYKPTAILVAEQDALLINSTKAFAELLGDTVPSAENPYPSLWRSFNESSVPALWITLKNSNHGSLAVAGPYWWPELQPSTFQQVFSPKEKYRLIDPQLAHQLQREKAVNFFDVYLKNDQQKKSDLIAGNGAHLNIHSKNIALD